MHCYPRKTYTELSKVKRTVTPPSIAVCSQKIDLHLNKPGLCLYCGTHPCCGKQARYVMPPDSKLQTCQSRCTIVRGTNFLQTQKPLSDQALHIQQHKSEWNLPGLLKSIFQSLSARQPNNCLQCDANMWHRHIDS